MISWEGSLDYMKLWWLEQVANFILTVSNHGVVSETDVIVQFRLRESVCQSRALQEMKV